MILPIITLLTLSVVAFATGVQYGRLIEIIKFKEKTNFWMDKLSMCKQED